MTDSIQLFRSAVKCVSKWWNERLAAGFQCVTWTLAISSPESHLTGNVVFGMPDLAYRGRGTKPSQHKVGLVLSTSPQKSAIRRAMHPRGRQDTEEKLKILHKISSIGVGAACLIGMAVGAGTAMAEWKPTKSVEFIVPAG